MNIIRSIAASALSCMLVTFAACSDKDAETLALQSENINKFVAAAAQDSPLLIASAKAQYANDTISVDVALSDSLLSVDRISDPLFDFFTACQVKDNLNKNLEETVNAKPGKKAPMIVTLTDVYGNSRAYELTAAKFRQMIKQPLTQLNYNEARDELFNNFAATASIFAPADAKVKEVTTNFKGGFYDFNVCFEKTASYKGLTTANLKARALAVFERKYNRLGAMHPAFIQMFKALGVEGFHLIYSAGEKDKTLKTTVKISDI